MSTVEVRLFANLRKYYPNPETNEAISIELNDRAQLRDLLDMLRIPRQELGILMVNGKWQKESYLLRDGDRIGIFPLIGGG